MQPSFLEGGAEILPCPADFPTPDNTVLCLPIRMRDGQIIYSANTPTIEKLLRAASLDASRPPLKGQVLYRDEQSIVWLGPILFFSAAALANNPNLISTALGVISNYITDFFRGVSAPKTEISLDIIQEIEPQRRYRRVMYKGSADGLKSLPAALRETFKDAEPQEKKNG